MLIKAIEKGEEEVHLFNAVEVQLEGSISKVFPLLSMAINLVGFCAIKFENVKATIAENNILLNQLFNKFTKFFKLKINYK